MALDPPLDGFDGVSDFVITRGVFTLIDDETTTTVEGSIGFTWTPAPRLVFEASSRGDRAVYLGRVDADVPMLDLRAKCWLSQQTGLGIQTKYDGFLNEPVHSGPVASVEELRFVLVNFNATHVTEVTAGDWLLRLEPVPRLRDLLRESAAARSHVCTHIGLLRRVDRASFLPEDAEAVREHLYWALSFARGQSVGICLTTGFDDTGEAVWREWRETNVDRAAARLSWFEPQDASALPELVTRFADAWATDLRSSIPIGLSFYVQANTGSSPETALVVGCAGLDLMAWVGLVEGDAGVSVEGFEKLPASDRIRLMLAQAAVPREIPPELESLCRHATTAKWADGPHAVTELRNSVIHPRRRERIFDAPVQVRVEAARLMLWYFDIALLQLVGYRGNYLSHAVSATTGTRVHGLSTVPWAK